MVRERVKEFEQHLEEKEAARLHERQQQYEEEKQGSLEEWLAERMCQEFERQKHSQREFTKKWWRMLTSYTRRLIQR